MGSGADVLVGDGVITGGPTGGAAGSGLSGGSMSPVGGAGKGGGVGTTVASGPGASGLGNGMPPVGESDSVPPCVGFSPGSSPCGLSVQDTVPNAAMQPKIRQVTSGSKQTPRHFGISITQTSSVLEYAQGARRITALQLLRDATQIAG